ncbi:MAG: nuclear transport factor 2 family protein [Sphingomonadales bacterium]|nr:nuclear transport factor 2 family protein [Sphingomonadales bacterium]
MTDRDQIVDALNLYALAVDTRRWDLFDRIFAAHCEADYGSAAHWHELTVFKADFAAFHAAFDATQHVMANHQVRVSGGRAHSLTYGTWRLVRHAAEGGPLWDGSGWYDDTWVRGDMGWRLVKRTCRVIWYTGNDRVRQLSEDVAFVDERTTLAIEAAAGRVAYLSAVDAEIQ